MWFLNWKGVAVSKLGNMVNMYLLFQQFASDRRDDEGNTAYTGDTG